MRHLLVLALAACPAAAAAPPSVEDAPLRAVQFIDASVGWAVGDHGVVWYTIDGGKTWERQRTGTPASLRSVHFLTPYTGWAAGRIDTPTGSQGVLLATDDGGGTWTEVTTSTLPGLNVVRFFDEKCGIVAGDGTDAFPTGAFQTSDGGRTWAAVAGPRGTSWLCGVFASPASGFVGGAWGKLMRVRDGQFAPVELDPLAGRAVRGFVADANRAVAVCDRGRVLTSTTGTKWGVAALPIPDSAADVTDLRCVAAAGNHVWAAGRPGTVVFHSPDYGKTWEVQKTGQPVPINSITMIDEQTGVAVGDLGTILATNDGGKTWAVRKCGGLRSGVLFAHAKADRVPLATVAAVGDRDGYLTAAVTLTSADPATADPKRAADEFRLGTAVHSCGGAVGETICGYPVPGYAEMNSGLPEDLIRQLVLTLRTWRPEVVVCDPFPTGNAVEEAGLAAVNEAFKKAGDPTAFPEQIEHLGLAPHAAKKLYALSADTPEAAVKLDLGTFAAELADTPRDAAEPFTGLTGASVSGRQCFRLLAHQMEGADQHAALTDGLDLAPGGAARRAARSAALAGTALVDRENAVRARRQLEATALHPETAGGAEKALAHVAGALGGMPDDLACRTAVGLGRQFAADGRWTSAREMFALAADRYPAHPDTAEALRWLTRYYASSEVRRRIELGHQTVFQKSAFVLKGASVGVSDSGKTENPITPVRYSTGTDTDTDTLIRQVYQFSNPDAVKRWNQACMDLEPKLAGFGAAFSREPATNLSLLAARRQLGLSGDASKQAAALVRAAGGVAPTAGSDPWRDCVAAELWLSNPQAVPHPPKPVGVARKTGTKPMLDGKLDDACWKDAVPLPMADTAGMTAGAYPTRAMVAYDDGYLYLAVRSGHPAGEQVPTVTNRGYDADLTGHDRVELLLDLDRDYQTYYRLRIDHRGCVADDCWGDKGWNPKWFAAADAGADGWTAEVAVPLAELAGTPPAGAAVWAANVVRVLPDRGVQAWSGPADATPRPEGMGLLRFLEGK